MSLAASPNFEVDEPIINDAFEEPTRHWLIRKGERPTLVPTRRPAQYYWRPARLEPGVPPGGLLLKLDIVNRIRDERKRWRADGYPGATSVTRELLDYWERPQRDRKIIYAQREAAETIIFLKEAPLQYKQGLVVPRDDPNPAEGPEAYHGFERLGVKMATGTGKTTVMGLVAAWSILNHLADPRNRRYSDTILVLCPNVTIRERLAELDPKRGHASIYRIRDIVHPSRMLDLARGTVVVTNWHTLQPHAGNEVGGVTAAVVNKGPESDRVVVSRVLGPGALGKKNVLVFNDEAHHAYRIPPEPASPQQRLDDDFEEMDEEERREATVWVEGIDKLARERGVNFALDLSATPLIRNGPQAGRLFPWVVSDFGLVDAIECGLVKIPQLPIADPTGGEVPKYFNIWDWIVKEKLTMTERGGKRGAVKPEAVVAHAKLPLRILADDWRKTFQLWRDEAEAGHREHVPPVFIVVCRDTKLAAVVFDVLARKPAGEEALVPEFVNTDTEENTIRVDSKVAQEMESGSKSVEARRLRFLLDTIGRSKWPGDQIPEEWRLLAEELGIDPAKPPGRDVRCIVSVGMLTEGWDATTVTHIVGIRPFQSQLLCEQVVGRALRRAQWKDLKKEEVARIFGVPFEVVPFKAARPKGRGASDPSVHVHPRADREHLAIHFPRVARYVPLVRGRIVADWKNIPLRYLDPMETPNEVVVQGLSIDEKGQLTRAGVGKQARLGLDAARAAVRLQQLEFRLASKLTQSLAAGLSLSPNQVFPDVLSITRKYLQTKVIPKGGFQRVDLAFYEPWFNRAFEDLIQSLGSSDGDGIAELPVYELDRPEGSTFDVDFWTSRRVHETTKSHLNYAVADTARWEQAAAYHLDHSEHVISYAKNFDMGFTIPYTWKGERHDYHPDYLVRMGRDGKVVGTLILEVKGFLDERAMVSAQAANRWVGAVNRDGRYGRWDYAMCRDPAQLESYLALSAQDLAAGVAGGRARGALPELETFGDP